MKKILFTITVIILTFTSINAQDEARDGELIINFDNRPSNWELTVKIEAYGTVWDRYHYIASDFQGGDTTYYSNQYPEPTYHASDLEWHYQGYDPVLSLGLYEVSIWESGAKQAWFYIDYRTSDLPTVAGYGIDVVTSYNFVTKDLEFTSPITGQITNGSYHPIWEIRGTIDLLTNGLENYWDNCLVLIPSQNNNPRLVWGKYPEPVDLAGYNIYRKIGSGSFSYIHFNNEMQLDYVDTDYTITEPTGSQLQYYVKAGYVSRELSEPTNIVTTQGMSLQKAELLLNSKNDTYSLSNCYPNPFNPTTKINYTIPENNFVSLKVFDVLGRKVVTLVNETKEAGEHSIEFDGKSLPSGIYFYKLQSGNYIKIRKMILQK